MNLPDRLKPHAEVIFEMIAMDPGDTLTVRSAIRGLPEYDSLSPDDRQLLVDYCEASHERP